MKDAAKVRKIIDIRKKKTKKPACDAGELTYRILV
jgi:hypothetical protein